MERVLRKKDYEDSRIALETVLNGLFNFLKRDLAEGYLQHRFGGVCSNN